MNRVSRSAVGLLVASLAVLGLGSLGCGGGKTSTGGTLTQVSTAPTATLSGWSPADATLGQYKAYVFSATATDPNIGGSITEFRWDFGDGTGTQVTPVVLSGGKATTTCTHAFLTSGAKTVSVVAKNAAGMLSTASTQTLTVSEGPSPVTAAFVAPATAVSVSAPLGGSAAVTFTVSATDSGTGTLSASGITLDPGDPTATKTAPVSAGTGQWSITVTYPAASATGSRTVTPTLTVVDSNQISSAVVTGPAVTIRTVSLVNTPPVVTLTATPAIPAGSNATWQRVAIAFKATATDADGDPLTYAWTFGDGGSGDVGATQAASALDQLHTYASAGVYPVTFTANDGRTGGAKSITLNLNILPNARPTVSVAVSPSGSTYANVPITFTATVADADGDHPTLTWDLGDGSAPVTGVTTLTHSFAAAGSTFVSATADDAKGGITTSITPLTVLANRAPVAALTTPAADLYQRRAYTFTASATDPDAGDTVSQYHWDFGDGTAVQTTAAPSAIHTYATTFTGPAVVKVQAVDNHGSVGDWSPGVTFTVKPTQLPVVSVVSPAGAVSLNTEVGALVGKHRLVSFVVRVTNPNGAAGTYLPLSSVVFSANDALSTVVSSTDNHDGTYTFVVRYAPAAAKDDPTGRTSAAAVAGVTDGVGVTGLGVTAPTVTIVTQASNQPPVAMLVSLPAIEAGGSAVTTWQGVAVTFTATATDPDNDGLTYSWDFGDGTVLTGLTAATALSQVHTYASAAAYAVKFTADDSRTNGTKEADLTMNVLVNRAPSLSVAKTIPSGTPTKYQRVTFTATVGDLDGDIPTLTWNFGDGSALVTASATNPTQVHQFMVAGLTNVVVTADDGKGGMTTFTLPVTVLENNPPVALVTTAAATLYQNKSYTFGATATDLDGTDTIASYEWSFGDGTAVASSVAGSASHSYAATFTGSALVRVRAIDSRGAVGDWSPAVTFTVVTTPLPVVTFTSPVPTTLNVDLGGTVTQVFTLTATNPRAGAAGVTDPIPVGNLTFLANDALATVTNAVSLGGGSYAVTVSYAGAASAGTRTSTPTAYATDTLGIQGLPGSGPLMTLKTLGANHAPAITLTTPATDGTVAYTSRLFTLGFTLMDADNDPVTYTVDWGDGTATTTGSPTGDFTAGVPVTATHTYADAFTATAQSVPVVVTATDNRSASALATPRTRLVTVTFNTLPTATITSPQPSGTAPTGLPAGISAPYAVIPLNGKLSFAGTATLPASQDAVTSAWAFPGGVPSSGTGDTPGEVTFAGTAGSITPVTVTYTVTDALGRSATATRLVLVDGLNTQLFNLAFLYRQKSDNNGTSSTTPVTTAANGLGVSVQVYQDGQSGAYGVQDQATLTGAKASVAIPVRSDLPFWIQVPSFGSDAASYLMRIPNAPTGSYADSTLAVPLPAGSSSFSFGSASAPWNPTLQIVTAQGFAPEADAAPQRRLNGYTDLVLGTALPNERWLDRLSVPLGDATGPIQWAQSKTAAALLTGITAYQRFAEWPVLMLTRATVDLGGADITATAGTSSDLGFVLDYGKYSADFSSSANDTFAAFSMQAYRVPAGSTDPYQLSPAWQGAAELNSTALDAHAGLNPVPLDAAPQTFLANLVAGAPGSTALHGGIASLPLPYDPNDPDRTPLALALLKTRLYADIRSVFSYSEYLWSSVWARPLVLNSARPNYSYSPTLGSYGLFRYSNPVAWPKASGISPDNSAFDLTASGGGVFDGAAPVGLAGAAAPTTGVGRFFWTAYTPHYEGDANAGAGIARTWLSNATTKQVPTTFSGTASGDATVAFGFMVPQDTMVDKRGRNADGSLSGSALGGYRVTWYNPTRDASGNPVPPDFWVVELDTGTRQQFLLPGSFPTATQAVGDAILTDARTYLPSGQAATAGPLTGDKVGPGYCWFDIPPEVRPTGSATLTVFAVKAILRNQPLAAARPLNRTDWIDAIKTATATMKMLVSSGRDLTYAYKIPFNYAWDIVITNGPATPVAP